MMGIAPAHRRITQLSFQLKNPCNPAPVYRFNPRSHHFQPKTDTMSLSTLPTNSDSHFLLKNARLIATTALLMAGFWGCKTASTTVQQPAPAQPVILTLGDRPFSTDDFFQSFTKNQTTGDSAQRTDIKDYFDLYTNMKLKVLAAESGGRDTTEGFREEMTTYRKQLAQNHLIDKSAVEVMANEAYQRMQQEVSASHILIPVADEALPADTLTAYEEAGAIRKRALAGEDFAALANQFSKDANSAAKGGNLGYFTAFSTVYPFETAAYATPVGGISEPIRTKSGYHIIRVNDRRTGRGKVQVAHILVRLSPSADPAGQQALKARINAIYDRLQKGESFEMLVRETSDDATSRTNGGILPAFETGRNVPAFEEAAFALTTPGSYSKPVQTNYGWHILKLIARKPIEPFNELGPALRQKVVTDTRADVLRQATEKRLRREYVVTENKSALTSVLVKADSNLVRGRWKAVSITDSELLGKTLFSISTKPYTVQQFVQYAQQKQTPRQAGAAPVVVMQRLYNRFVGDQLMATEEQNLDRKSPEFRAMLTEIRDGVLLSEMMEENVWERSMTDSTGQKQHYEANKNRYKQPERAVALIIEAANDDVLKQTNEMLKGNPYQLRRSGPAVLFGPNETAIPANQRETMYQLLVTMVRNADYLVEVSGAHATGEADSVSAGRIRSVVNSLTRSGILLTRIMEKDNKSFGNTTSPRQVTFQFFSTNKLDIAKAINAAKPNSVTITEGIFARGTNTYLDAFPWKPTTTTTPDGNKIVQVIVSRVDPARLKTFAEARGTVINEYQAILEKRWLATLRQRYPVKVNEDELRKLMK